MRALVSSVLLGAFTLTLFVFAACNGLVGNTDVQLLDAGTDATAPIDAQSPPAPTGSEGGSSTSCGPSTCPDGCCSATGACLVQTDGACGKGGALCTACAQGQHCAAEPGRCTCDSTSCPTGCCDANQLCVPETAQGPTTCGSHGNACGACATGQACSNGACTCGGMACDGCCDSTGTCATSSGASCGLGGVTCQTCASTQTCGAQGKCTCDATSCPNGCCDGDTCVAFSDQDDKTCGAGKACGTCPDGLGCDKSSGACVCNAGSCPNGCCAGGAGGTCTAPTFPMQCGSGGTTCSACTDAHLANTCVASGCGCGSGPACSAGTTPTCCGSAGSASCADLASDPKNCGTCGHSCGGGKCSAGACQPFAIATGRTNPLNMAIDGSNIYWTENDTGGVYQVAKGGGTVITLRTPPMSGTIGNSSWAVTTDATPDTMINGNAAHVFWTDRAENTVGVNTVNGPASNAATLATSPNASGGPYGITFGGQGYVYVSDFNVGKIWWATPSLRGVTGTDQFATATGATGLFMYRFDLLWTSYSSGTTYSNGVSQSSGANVDSRYVTSDGTTVFWTASDGNQIWYAPLTMTASTAAPGLLSTESQPWGIAADALNSVYWVNKTNGQIRHATRVGNTWALSTIGNANAPTDIRADALAVYWTDTGNGQVMQLNK